MTFSLMSAFMPRYYVNVALMDTAIVAVMTLIWKICDAVGNPIIGVMIDKSVAKSNNKNGKFRPWILRVVPLVAILGLIGYNATVAVQNSGTILGIKVLCLLFPAVCALGSWFVFRFVWNITPEVREKMAQWRAAQ